VSDFHIFFILPQSVSSFSGLTTSLTNTIVNAICDVVSSASSTPSPSPSPSPSVAQCQTTTQMDVIIAIDGTDSLSNSDFISQLQFAYDLMGRFNIDPSVTRGSVIQYARWAWTHVALAAQTKAVLLNSICASGDCKHCFPCEVPTRRSDVLEEVDTCANKTLMNNGRCEADLFSMNAPSCQWDGGDCCETTCTDQAYTCGASSPYQCADTEGNCNTTPQFSLTMAKFRFMPSTFCAYVINLPLLPLLTTIACHSLKMFFSGYPHLNYGYLLAGDNQAKFASRKACCATYQCTADSKCPTSDSCCCFESGEQHLIQ
jgi:hypothetical protein